MNSPQKMKLLDSNELSLQFEKSSFKCSQPVSHVANATSVFQLYNILLSTYSYIGFTSSHLFAEAVHLW